MVWTSSWEGYAIGYARSRDLIEWEQKALSVMHEDELETKNVWAPELFYDEERERFLLTWSSTVYERFEETASSSEHGHNHRLYYTETTNFTSFAPPKLLYNPGFNIIDGSIIRDVDGTYLLFFKDERLRPQPYKTIRFATASRPEGPYGPPSAPFLQKGLWVEGPAPIIINGSLLLYFECYELKLYGAVMAPTPLLGDGVAAHKFAAGGQAPRVREWQDVTGKLRMPAGARHGAVLRVAPHLVARLLSLSTSEVSGEQAEGAASEQAANAGEAWRRPADARAEGDAAARGSDGGSEVGSPAFKHMGSFLRDKARESVLHRDVKPADPAPNLWGLLSRPKQGAGTGSVQSIRESFHQHLQAVVHHRHRWGRSDGEDWDGEDWGADEL